MKNIKYENIRHESKKGYSTWRYKYINKKKLFISMQFYFYIKKDWQNVLKKVSFFCLGTLTPAFQVSYYLDFGQRYG